MAPDAVQKAGEDEIKHSKSIGFESIEKREEIMVMLKISSFLAVYALVVCQMDSFQAAPVRPGLESITDRVTLSDYEARRLLNALVKEFIQMTAEELEQASEGNSVTAQKRACNTATCVTHRLADFLSRSGGVGKNNFVPTNVGSKAFGRRRRSVQI
ncbi:calcitonin gene-related peptide isoform X2 [Gallus gallus]|uniref:Calcitonin n=9 Tax=Neognathae TaxID=8825 RepID=A0A8V0ZU90_CHICK|nr:calcitonin gene-related peptide isoform X2 [Gallus gallus]XP_046773865.1 calcitonin gene-related peptide isoform X2 [Gallus gallus]